MNQIKEKIEERKNEIIKMVRSNLGSYTEGFLDGHNSYKQELLKKVEADRKEYPDDISGCDCGGNSKGLQITAFNDGLDRVKEIINNT